MPNYRKPYPPEFRAEAVRLSLQRGDRWKDVAAELGVSGETLRLWRKQAAVDAKLADGLTTAEQEELRRLRRRVCIVEEEHDILKKAVAFMRTARLCGTGRRSWRLALVAGGAAG